VTIHEFLGTLVYETTRRPKVVQFWRMEAAEAPACALMRDVKAVHWLVLADAINRLTHLRERVFLEQVGPMALNLAERSASALFREHTDGILVPGVPLAPASSDASLFDASLTDDEVAHALAERAGPRPFDQGFTAYRAPETDVLTAGPSGQELTGQVLEMDTAGGLLNEMHAAGGNPVRENPAEEKSVAGKTLMKKTWGWFRRAAPLHRPPLD
jgi:hypothetical protein